MSFLRRARDSPVCFKGVVDLPFVCDSGMLVLLSSGIWDTLEKMGVTPVLQKYCVEMSLDYMAYCRLWDVEWP